MDSSRLSCQLPASIISTSPWANAVTLKASSIYVGEWPLEERPSYEIIGSVEADCQG